MGLPAASFLVSKLIRLQRQHTRTALLTACNPCVDLPPAVDCTTQKLIENIALAGVPGEPSALR